MPITELIVDLDNTLYPSDLGVVERVDGAITRFMIDELGVSADDAHAMRARYRDAHGTTLHGLMLHHDVEPDRYLATVHAIELDDLLAPDPALHVMLTELPHRKTILTNGSATHAERVLARLGVRACFHDVFSLERVAYVPKPLPGAYKPVLAALGADPRACLYVDDRVDNLRTARALGMWAVLVDAAASNGQPAAADASIPSIHDLPAVLATLDR